ncbi:14.5 kDa protein [Human mastadenovirus E]|uniref:14.5 kDa protein n=1 Tax=Human mastadenovirus E TaxID=130308 RepID=A0A2R3WN34_9ADEN|nr:14.5 kDa protein [Human mastadenovirus E]
MRALLLLTLLLLLAPLVAPFPLKSPTQSPKEVRKCKFQEPWKFLKCYQLKSDMHPSWIIIMGIVNILACTLFSFVIYPRFDFGWNAPKALWLPPAPNTPPQQQQNQAHAPPPQPRPQYMPILDYEAEPQQAMLPAISYFNLTGEDD